MKTDCKIVLHYGDLSDSMSLVRIIQQIQPDEIYNLGAQSTLPSHLKPLNTQQTQLALVHFAY